MGELLAHVSGRVGSGSIAMSGKLSLPKGEERIEFEMDRRETLRMLREISAERQEFVPWLELLEAGD